MRFLLTISALLLALNAFAEEVKVLVQSSPLAGSQYYALSSVWDEIRPVMGSEINNRKTVR